MKQVTLNTDSWHFKYYSLIVSDKPPKSLCPYFWTMVLLMLLSPIIGFVLAIMFVNKHVSNFFDSILPKKVKPEETLEETLARWKRKEEAEKKRERFWNKAGDIFLLFLKFIVLPAIVLIVVYTLYNQVVKTGWLTTLMVTGLVLLFALFIVGVIKLYEFIGEKLSGLPKGTFNILNPFNWKVTQIVGEMIKAQYTKMCPLITWEGEKAKKNIEDYSWDD